MVGCNGFVPIPGKFYEILKGMWNLGRLAGSNFLIF